MNNTHAPKNEAPVGWDTLLVKAVTEPGVLSAAYSAFHNYSFGNQMLAMHQCLSRGITPGPLATFKRWQANGRCVRRGEKAIILCMPVTFKKDVQTAAGTTEEKTFCAFKYKPMWFALSQTEGQEYQAQEVTKGKWNKSLALEALKIEETAFDHMNGNCQGFAQGRKIAVSPIAALPHKTTFHEIAHILLGHTENPEEMDRAEKEVEAESVAYILLETLGLPGAAESRGYIQNWLGRGGKIEDKNAKRIFSAAEKILKAGQEKAEKEDQETVEAA